MINNFLIALYIHNGIMHSHYYFGHIKHKMNFHCLTLTLFKKIFILLFNSLVLSNWSNVSTNEGISHIAVHWSTSTSLIIHKKQVKELNWPIRFLAILIWHTSARHISITAFLSRIFDDVCVFNVYNLSLFLLHCIENDIGNNLGGCLTK